MRLFILLLSGGIFLLSCNNNKSENKADPVSGEQKIPANNAMLITDSSWGPISRSADFEGLKQALGASNIKDMRVCGPECIDSIDITVLFPDTKNSATVYWREGAYHKTIERIEAYEDSSGWFTSQDLKLGDGIDELLSLNGKKISFYGFSWDYGGTISSYNQGKLEKSPFVFTLENTGNDGALDGDSEFDTEMTDAEKKPAAYPYQKHWFDHEPVGAIIFLIDTYITEHP